jgi:hypothetical protein
LDEDEYHAVPALSSSGVKNLRMSPLDFYMRASWLNAHYEAENEDTEDSFAQITGRAYHKRILEGREAFAALYAPALDKASIKDLLVTMDDLRGKLESLGLPKSAKRKQDAIDRILEAEPTAKIWDVIEDGYIKSHPGKTFLPQKLMDKIELSAAMIEKDTNLCKAFSGGMPEVSVFWTCQKSGVNCKARFDYLKPKALIDLKTFANKSGYPIERAIERELSYNRYPIQAAWYYEAAGQIFHLMNQGKVYGEAPHIYLSGLHANAEKTFVYIFQQKGVAPLARGRSLPRFSTHVQVAAAACDAAKQTYRQCWDTFGTDPWLTSEPIQTFDDARIPALWE